MAGWLRVRPFPEADAALERLGRGGQRQLAILSNGTPTMLQAAVRNAGLGVRFAALLSVDAVRTYKPDPRVYQLGLDTFGGAPADFLFVSSNAWDAAGARAFGYPVAWLNRAGAPPERLGVSPDLVLPNLMALADALAEG
jgi:2-haloacid dehalogenase